MEFINRLWAHIAIGNLKAFQLYTFTVYRPSICRIISISSVNRFSQRMWKAPCYRYAFSLLNVCLRHIQIKLIMV